MYQGNCILHITYRSKRYIIHTANLQHNYTDFPQKMIIELSTTSITSLCIVSHLCQHFDGSDLPNILICRDY